MHSRGRAVSPTGAFFAGCAGPTLTPTEAAFFRASNPVGFILFARNIETPDQVRALTSALRSAVGRDAPVLIDQEGGRVQRMTAPHWQVWEPPLSDAAHPDATARIALRYRIIAAELRAVGIDVNCVPCADVARADTHPVLRNRCFGSDPETVAHLARAAATGTLAGGVLPVVKHMPGHGAATLDSHLELPRVALDPATLAAVDFAAFHALSDLPLAMSAHVVYTRLDADRPATVSPVMHRVMRDQIGFDGFLMTDDISMQALQGDMAARCRAAIAAGCDAILHCNGDLSEMEVVADTAGALTPLAEKRLTRALAMRRDPADDLADLLNRWRLDHAG